MATIIVFSLEVRPGPLIRRLESRSPLWRIANRSPGMTHVAMPAPTASRMENPLGLVAASRGGISTVPELGLCRAPRQTRCVHSLRSSRILIRSDFLTHYYDFRLKSECARCRCPQAAQSRQYRVFVC